MSNKNQLAALSIAMVTSNKHDVISPEKSKTKQEYPGQGYNKPSKEKIGTNRLSKKQRKIRRNKRKNSR